MKAKRRSLYLVAIIALTGLIFVLDLLFPLGIVIWVLYLPVLVASLWLRPGRAIGIVRDITKRKQAEQKLRESEERYRALVENAAHGICVNVDGKFSYVNPAAQRMLGATRAEELVGRTVLDRIHPDFHDIVQARIRNMLETKRPAPALEEKMFRLDGSEVNVEAAATPCSYQGRPGIQVMVRDITERKQMEEALRESEALFRAIFENSGVGIAMADARTGRLIRVNHRYCAITGYQESELIGRSIKEITYPDDWPRDQEALPGAAEEPGFIHETEQRYVRKDGSLIWVHVAVTLLRNLRENREVRIGVVEDISDRKHAEEQLLRWNVKLEERVEQRAAELTRVNAELVRSLAERETLEEELRQAQKMEAIGTLAGGIAHDFNNILAIILGYSRELLREDKQDSKALSRNLQAIVSAAERGAKVVRQLLTFARKTPRQDGPVDMNLQIHQLVDTVTELFPKRITYSVALDPIFPPVWGDRVELQQVLINLCINARDAMPDGGRLSITTAKVAGRFLRERYPEAQDDLYVRIDVADTGTGMDEETRRRIFEPFFTTKRETGGTGLGLAVVYGIIQSHRGLIEVESEQGRGSKFSVFLPARSDLSEAFDLRKEDRSQIIGGNETIFIVEDEAQIRQLLTSLLERKGYRILAAQDGEEAVQIYQKHKEQISLVVLDIGLPGLSGRELHLRLKELGSRVKVLVLSGYLDPDIREELLKEGVDAFLQKPCMGDEILKTVAEVLGQNRDVRTHRRRKARLKSPLPSRLRPSL